MSAVENQEINNNTVDVFKSDIDMYINLWMEERHIEDLCKVSQNRWYNCCKYVYENVFKVNPKYLRMIIILIMPMIQIRLTRY